MTQEHHIEKAVRKVYFKLANGEEISGETFLSHYDARHSGPQNVGDLLRASDPFFPVKTDEGIVLINLAQLVYARLAREEEEDELMRLGASSQSVSVQTLLKETMEGEIFLNRREGRFERVQDYVNESKESFLRLFQAETILYINQKFIVSIRDSL